MIINTFLYRKIDSSVDLFEEYTEGGDVLSLKQNANIERRKFIAIQTRR